MLSGNLVAVEEEIKRVSLDGSVVEVGDLDGTPPCKVNLELFGFIGGILGADSHLEHGRLRGAVGILEHATFVGSVEEILIDGVVGLGLGIDGDAVLGAVGEQVLAALEALNEFGITPRGNGLDGGGECLCAHLEAHLVISLSGGSVGNVLSSLFVGDADHFLGNAWTGNGGAEQVAALVDGVALDSLKDIVLDKVGAEVGDDALEGAAGDSLGLDGREVLFVLSDVGAESNHIEAFLAKPLENDRGIETSRVGENDLRLGVAHFVRASCDCQKREL